MKKVLSYLGCFLFMAAAFMFGQAVKAGGDEYKVIFVGDSSVGKTSIINKMFNLRSTDDCYPTVNAAYAKLGYTSQNGSPITFGIWDTAGQERFRAICKNFLRGADIALIVCSVDDQESRYNVARWIGDIMEFNPNLSLENILVVLNKIDLLEENNESCLSELPTAVGYSISLIAVSAKTGNNIDLLLERMAEVAQNTVQTQHNVINLELNDEKPSKKGCC